MNISLLSSFEGNLFTALSNQETSEHFKVTAQVYRCRLCLCPRIPGCSSMLHYSSVWRVWCLSQVFGTGWYKAITMVLARPPMFAGCALDKSWWLSSHISSYHGYAAPMVLPDLSRCATDSTHRYLPRTHPSSCPGKARTTPRRLA